MALFGDRFLFLFFFLFSRLRAQKRRLAQCAATDEAAAIGAQLRTLVAAEPSIASDARVRAARLRAAAHSALREPLLAAEALREALAALAVGARRTRGDVQLALGAALLAGGGEAREALGALERARELLAAERERDGGADDAALRSSLVQCNVLLARELARRGAVDRSNRRWDDVLELCEPLPTSGEEWEAYSGLAANYAALDSSHARLALSSHREALATAEALNEPRLTRISRAALASYLAGTWLPRPHEQARVDALNEARALTELIVDDVRAAGDAAARAFAVQALLLQARLAAERSDAKRALDEACRVAEQTGDKFVQLTALRSLAEWHSEGGEHGEAAHVLMRCARMPADADVASAKAHALSDLAQAHTALNNVDSAVEALEQANSLFDQAAEQFSGGAASEIAKSQMSALTRLSAALRKRGERRKADAALARAVSLARVLHENGYLDDIPAELKNIEVRPESPKADPK